MRLITKITVTRTSKGNVVCRLILKLGSQIPNAYKRISTQSPMNLLSLL